MRRFARVALLLAAASPLVSFAQRIENVKATVVGEKVVITYDINGALPDAKFRIQLFASNNNFSTPLARVTGDVGDVTGGAGKRIEWDARAELQTYSGDISFEVRGVAAGSPLSFRSPAAGAKIKIGKTTNISWTGGNSGQGVNIDLIQNNQPVRRLAQTSNSGSYSWLVTKDMAKGDGYQLVLTSGGSTATSQPFSIRKKTSPLVFILPVAAAGGAAALLSGGGGGGGGGGGTDNGTDLPVPPDPQ